ncbi:putative Saccharopine dehydrogenase [Eremomyces bilateralis CBS 781.70]|uniref:Saccharopine dehydrogenase [NADP(+), L-glutamate-forming] n=1 Tax=Eremomyces bilateralis CBS 781.70 TaxID=1392243 RepID=A0A6G1GFW6_9PEZI|nr:putative Saccharopine dehydrogenase [Eremomyces bilateralis CBS 781.70]KAF1816750.1 putative Saccharopine dehydrogenase [Eremomyces bilateralis CBS 781.70]
MASNSYSVLLLGAGFVARPTAQILSDSGVKVTVACRTLESAKSLSSGLANCTPISLDVDDTAALDGEVSKVDLAISLIPYIHHTKVIKSAIRHKKHVVTTSYVSPAMAALDQEAKDAGISVFNEIGMDPGIDHLYAIKTIAEVHEAKGKLVSFLSYCGGLPAPENSDNPLGYKFSWSARGVLLALRRTARYWKDDKEIDLRPEELMASARPYRTFPGFAFVAYPNGDSVPYKQRYNIPECRTIIRGSLRYDGFPELAKVFGDIGFLSEEQKDYLDPNSSSPPTWAEVTSKVIGSSSSKEEDLVRAISSKISFRDNDEKERILDGLRWIGMLSSTEKATASGTPLDTLCASLAAKMGYAEGERDLVFLQHTFGIEWADGKKETRTSTLVEFGDPKGYTAMTKLVGVPCAIAVLKVLDGTITRKGIFAPMDMEIAGPVMAELESKYGITMKEKTLSLQ